MIFAFFTACMINNAAGTVECSNSYTEMTSVIRKGESCETVAKQLHQGVVDSVLITMPRAIVAHQRSGCGTFAQVKAEAEKIHFSYVKEGIPSFVFEF